MSEPLPEGVEIDVLVYLTSPSTGLDMVVRLRGLRDVPDPSKVDIAVLGASLPIGVDDWRVMSREEIAEYKADAESEDA